MGKTMNYKMKHTRRIVVTFIVLPLLVLIGALVSIAVRQNMFENGIIIPPIWKMP